SRVKPRRSAAHAAAASAAAVAVPNIVGAGVDAIAAAAAGASAEAGAEAGTGRLAVLLALLLGATALEWLTNRARLHIMADVGTRIVVDIRGDLFDHLQTLSLRFYDHYKVGRLMSRIMGDVTVLRDFVTWAIVGTARSVLTLLFILITLYARNWRLATLVLMVLPVMAVATRMWSRRAREAWREVRRRIAIINGYLNETVTGVRVIQSFTREPANEDIFDDLNRRHLDANLRAARLSAVFFPTVDVLGAVAVGIVVAYGALAPDRALSAGDLTAFALLVDRFFDPIRELSRRYNQLLATMAASERIFELLDLDPDVQDDPEAYDAPDLAGRVEFRDVWFAYGDEPVLRGIALDVPAGTTVALVGETGAGKTSIVNVLARFYDIRSGSVFVDGHDIRRLTKRSLRRQMGTVLQETYLFSGTIEENIRYGRPGADGAEIVAAAQAVGVDEFVQRLPEGYGSAVGERGVNLSVGQRQLVAFARALLADPRILILDEATSSVDTETEMVIRRALEHLLAGRTAFVIAHRLSTIVNADQIVVLSAGQVVEHGTHAQLLARRGAYYGLYTMQWAPRAAAAAALG
ncbi:MAG: ABC transporter ATP-binding protein, partial [Anaerolineae bacterium]